MKKPYFSVIIPTLNEELFLPNLLDSLAEQTKKNFEVIVVDGNSKDKTVAVANEFKKKLPSLYVVVSKKASLPLQRNLGAGKALGEWLIFIDADSILMPYFIERISVYIKAMKPRFFSTWASPDSDLIPDGIFTLLTNIYWEAAALIQRPAAPGPLSILSSSAFHAVGGYDEQHAFNEDVELGLRLDRNGIKFTMLRESLYIWSMRRIRREGKMKVMNQYVVSVLPVLLFKRPMRHMPGYVMGGEVYGKKKKVNRSVLRVYERKLKQLLKELFM